MYFSKERANLSIARKNLSALIETGDVAVPQDFPNLSSERVLTMSFEDGHYVNSSKCQNSFDLAAVSRTISKVFNEQIFRHGFVHCDPHEANILIRPHPRYKNKPQVVLLDHGLYRNLDDSFRRNYCRLWQALVLGDESKIKKVKKIFNEKKRNRYII